MSENGKSEPFGGVVKEVSERAGQWSYPWESLEVTVDEYGAPMSYRYAPKISRLTPYSFSDVRGIVNSVRFGLVPLIKGEYSEYSNSLLIQVIVALEELDDLGDVMDTVFSGRGWRLAMAVHATLLAIGSRFGKSCIGRPMPFPWQWEYREHMAPIVSRFWRRAEWKRAEAVRKAREAEWLSSKEG